MGSELRQITAGLLGKAIQERVTKTDFGLIVRNLPRFDLQALLQVLEPSLSLGEFFIALVGFSERVDIEWPQVATTVEQAIAWRNDTRITMPIVVLLDSHSEPEKMHSLELFESFEDNDLRMSVCQQGYQASDDNNQRQMWQILMRKDVSQAIPLVAMQVVGYYSALMNGVHYGRALPYLGLLSDPDIESYAGKANSELVKRLGHNSQQVQRLLTLSKSTFRALAGALTRARDEHRSTFLAIQSYSRHPSTKALQALELSAVDALFEAKASILTEVSGGEYDSSQSEHRRSTKSESTSVNEFVVDSWLDISGGLSPDVKEFLEGEISWYLEDPSTDRPLEHDGRDIDREAITIDGQEVEIVRPVDKEAKHPLEDAMRLWVQTDHWGGIVTPSYDEHQAESLSQLLEDAAALAFKPRQPLRWDDGSVMTSESSLLSLFEALERVIDDSGSHGERLADLLRKFGSQRTKLARYRVLFLYSPEYAVIDPETLSLIEVYIQTYESLAKRLQDIYPKAAEQYYDTIEQATAQFLALDVVIVDCPVKEAVCLTTLHPLHLWKWLELARRIRANKHSLSESERQLLHDRIEQLPTLLNTFVLHPAMFSPHRSHINEPRLALAGEIRNLRPRSDVPSIGIPFYQAIAHQSTTLDGFRHFEELLTKFLALYPPARIGIVMCLIDPPALEPVLATCAKLHIEGVLQGARIQVYHTDVRSLAYDEWRVDDSETLELFRDNPQFSLRIELQSKPYSVIIDALRKQGKQHVVLLCDPSEAVAQSILRISHERPDPFGIPLHVNYDQISDVVRLAPAPSGGIFDVYTNVRNALTGELYRRTLGVGNRHGITAQGLETVANMAHWLVVIDRPHGIVETRVGNVRRLAWRTAGTRTLAVYASEHDYRERWLEHFIDHQIESDYIDQYLDETLAVLPDGLLSTVGDPPIDEVQATHNAVRPQSVAMLLGITETLRWYRQERPSVALVSVSTEQFCDWFGVHAKACRNSSKNYLLAVSLEDAHLYIDIISVAAYDTIDGSFPSLSQSKSVLVCLDAFARTLGTLFEPGADAALLAPIRRELLRESLVTAIYAPMSQQSREVKARWAKAINELYSEVSLTLKLRDIRVVLDGGGRLHSQPIGDSGVYHCPAEVVTLPVGIEADDRRLSLGDSELTPPRVLSDKEELLERVETSDEVIELEPSVLTTEHTMSSRQADEIPSVLHLPDYEEIERQAAQLRQVLMDYGIAVAGVEARRTQVGPRVIRYWVSLQPPAGRLSEVQRIAVDLARELGCKSIPLIDNIPGERYVGIDLAREQPETVLLEPALDQLPKVQPNQLLIAMGVDTAGCDRQVDLARLPHMLVAGSTGSGKTVFLSSLIMSLVWRHPADNLELILVDPKQTDFIVFDQLPHLRGQGVLYEPDKVIGVLHELTETELTYRTRLLREAGCPNNLEYNRRHPDNRLPWVVVVVDEFADIMITLERSKREDFERLIARLAQIGRAKGIHLVLATQRPTTDVITGNIKANIPARVSFRLPSGIDSRTILDQTGAENLLGQGDMLTVTDGTVQRLQGYYASYTDLAKLLKQVID